jgi:hypothetical protein
VVIGKRRRHSPPQWTFGWEALVAIGTITLAAVTAGLAWSTRTVAQATRDEIGAAWRPVLLPQSAEIMQRSAQSPVSLKIKVKNVGRGPALEVTARLELPDGTTRHIGAPGEQPIPEPLPVEEELELQFSVDDPLQLSQLAQLSLSYVDLGDRSHQTRAELRDPFATKSGHVRRPCFMARVRIAPAE